MNDEAVDNTAEVLWVATGRAVLVGILAGTLLAGCRALAQLPLGELSYAAPVAAAVIVVFLLELYAAMLEAKTPNVRLATNTLTLLVLACAWLLARRVPPFNASLWMLLGSAMGGLAVDFAARRWRGAAGSGRLPTIAAGACLGSGLCLLWVRHPESSWMRSYCLGTLSAIPAGTLICLALRVRAHVDPSGPRSSSG